MFKLPLKSVSRRMAHSSQFYSPRMDRFEEPPIDYSEDDDEDRSGRSSVNMISVDPKSIPVIDFSSIQLEQLVGQGGFGKVYKARFRGRCVAVKEPIYYDASMVESINREIISEACLQFQLKHSNIVSLYGISFQSEKAYIVMEYAHGGSLRELISKRTLSPNVIIEFALQLANAMKYLHTLEPRAIIHRDLKSPNVLLNESVENGDISNKQLKLTDLGLAREFTHSTRMTQCGTYAWMAPETITDSKFSKASDVWSFGVVLWELLTGQIPYRDFSGPAIAYGIGNGKLTLPIPATCPEELKRILCACWRHDPKKRPQFNEILHQLENSSFNVINPRQFREMKRDWYDEIESIWQNLKQKEKELASREQETRKKEAEVEMMKRVLKQQSEELRKREIDVVSRELNVLLQQQMRVMTSPITRHRPTKKEVTKKKLLASNTEISSPKDFCHNLTVTTSHEDYAIPFLKAKALNQTWGPGSKIRTELNFDLFLQSTNHDETLAPTSSEHTNTVPTSRRKKLPGFLRKIFKSSKSIEKVNVQTNTEPPSSNDHDSDVEESNEVEECHNTSEYPRMFSINRTYHGQTKFSQRKRLDMFEHFQSLESRQTHSHTDWSTLESSSDVSSMWSVDEEACDDHSTKIECPTSSCSFPLKRQLTTAIGKETKVSQSASELFAPNTSKSQPEFSDDLLREFDKFEQAFASLNCSSRALASM